MDYQEIFDAACKEAQAAAKAFYDEHGDPYYCGFAWVTLAGNTGFGKWLKRKELASKSYIGSGLEVSFHKMGMPDDVGHTQCMEIRELACAAFARYLRQNHHIKASTRSRAD